MNYIIRFYGFEDKQQLAECLRSCADDIAAGDTMNSDWGWYLEVREDDD